ncbi:hypothetical protein Bhyg_07599 [Pseudolycoriella hygida]|uniref:Uncharacterized protein n=1 Tax=Pseudolycoriella hygida TaxID=35572 RepID=A0A9Q0N3B9_9DIPT|nr:hypothetical protein Bhyg_07599 [Pseudolycoriella hygida]
MSSDEQAASCRFIWKRNVKYDLSLLAEVNSRNPFAFNNPKQIWMDVADTLKSGVLNMKVTGRSCRERTAELLKVFRKNELISIRTSGASEEELSELKVLLTNVAKLEEAKPTKQLKTLYSTKDRNEAEAIRKSVLEGVEGLETRDLVDPVSEEQESEEESDWHTDVNRKRKCDDLDDFDFSYKTSKPTSSKSSLLMYLQNKSEREATLRREELSLRKKEAETKAKEVEIKREAKQKEYEIERMKAEAEIENQKKMMEILTKLLMEKKQ